MEEPRGRARRTTCAAALGALLVMLRGAIHLELRLASQREAAAVNSHESLIAAYDVPRVRPTSSPHSRFALDVMFLSVHCASLTMPYTRAARRDIIAPRTQPAALRKSRKSNESGR